MVCWLRFLQRVSEMLKNVEPNIYARKKLALDVLKDIEREQGHDVARIKKTLDDEGAGGLALRAQKYIKKKARKRIAEEESGVIVAEK